MSDERLRRLAAIDTATVHEAQGRLGALDPAIKPVWPAARLAARAFTARCHTGDNLAIHRAVAAAQHGDILVVDAGGHLAGYWGEVLCVAAQARGIVGLVIDGGCRDLEGVTALGFPIWARGVSIAGCTKLTPGAIGGSISCGGVVVETGDFVVADGDGVTIVAAGALDAALDAAELRIIKEREMMARLRAGSLTLDLLGLREVLARQGIDDDRSTEVEVDSGR
jgi:4-hydroxy-4-methyl-2-oxoglutarate aldolase